MSTPVYQTLPIGRQVFGDLYKARAKTDQTTGKPRTDRDGKPMIEYGIGYAIAKAGERVWWETPWGLALYQVAAAAAPQAVAAAAAEIQAGRDPSKYFAFKVIDGDSDIPNKRHKKPRDQEGHPGHWVLRLASSFAPTIYSANGTQVIDTPGVVKNGHYVQAHVSIVSNESQQSPGVYLNLGMVAHSGFGPEITSGPDASSVGFGGTLPPGASAVPQTAFTPPASAGGAPALPPAMAAAPPPALTAPPVAVAPAPSFLTPPGAAAAIVAPPPPPAVVAPPAPAAGPQTTAKAQGASWAALQAAGWTEVLARQHGMIL